MNKNLKMLMVMGIGFLQPIQAREIRTPLTPLAVPPLRGFIHYPVDEHDQEAEEGCWDIDVYGGAYARRADKAYTNDFGTETEPLASIFFGRSEFRLEQAFANSTAIVPRNPFVNFSVIKPDLEYLERGAVFGLTLSTLSLCGCYNVGFRSKLPVRFITVRQNNNCDCEGETIDDVCLLSHERYPQGDPVPGGATVDDAFAYRLDFLATLRDADSALFLNFANPMASNNVTFAGSDLTDGVGAVGEEIAGARVHLLGRPANGGRPTPNFGLEDTAVNQLAPLPADGSGLVFPNRAVFSSNINYSRLAPNTADSNTSACDSNLSNLSDIFVVPTIVFQQPVAGGNPNDIRKTDIATNVNEQVQRVIRTLDSSVLGFLDDVNLRLLDTQHQEGVGDLNTEIFVGRQFCDWNAYGEWQFGVKFPTGKKVRGTAKPLLMPLGNNGHVEVRIGGLLEWQALDWLYIHLDSNYSWVIKNCETVATPFRGACVKNVGPCINADVSWNYYIGHLNLTFVPPCNPYVGFALGYEPYVKQRDDIRIRGVDNAPDLQGNLQPIDVNVLEQRTRVISQKVITEFFYLEDSYNFSAGWTHVFAGQNAPKETDFYVGFGIYF